jgi:hypothetical protein
MGSPPKRTAGVSTCAPLPVRGKRRARSGKELDDPLDLARSPGVVEERLQRTVEAQDHEETLAGHRLDPVALGDAVAALGADVDRRRAVGAGAEHAILTRSITLETVPLVSQFDRLPGLGGETERLTASLGRQKGPP